MVRRIISKSSALYDRMNELFGAENLHFQEYRASLLRSGNAHFAHFDGKSQVKVSPKDEKRLESLLLEDEVFIAQVRGRYQEISEAYKNFKRDAERYD